MKAWVTMVALCAALTGCANDADTDAPVEVITAGPVALDLTVDGELRATRSTPLQVPGEQWSQRQLAWVAPDGGAVRKGDVLARFTANKGKLDLAKALLDLQRNQLLRQGKEDELTTVDERVAADLAKVDIDIGIARRYAGADGLDMLARNKILDAVQDLGFLGGKEDYLSWKRDQSQGRGAAELAVLDSQRASFQMTAASREADVQALELKAPHDGVFLLASDWTGEKPILGETVYSGSEFATLPNLGDMKVEIQVPQQLAQGLKVKAPAVIAPLGQPEAEIDSEILFVASNAQIRGRQNPIKYVRVDVAVPAEAITRLGLVPGQTMRARLFARRAERGLSVPNVALVSSNGSHFVDVRDGDGFTRREVRLGERGHARSEVVDGLREGDVVLLTPESRGDEASS